MENYKRTSHTLYDCKYHIVWTTKYRYPVLVEDVGKKVREIIREVTKAYGMEIHAGSVNRDHIHLLITIPPQISVSKALQ